MAFHLGTLLRRAALPPAPSKTDFHYPWFCVEHSSRAPPSAQTVPPPPHQGALLRLNCQRILFSTRLWFSSLSLQTLFSQLAAPTNVVPLSEYIFCGRPFLAMNFFKLSRNSCVSRDAIKSRYSARHNKQVYTAIRFPFGFRSFPVTDGSRVVYANDLERMRSSSTIFGQVSRTGFCYHSSLKPTTAVTLLHSFLDQPS